MREATISFRQTDRQRKRGGFGGGKAEEFGG
jgi:hypothetical protein